jgi:hypothetical protein
MQAGIMFQEVLLEMMLEARLDQARRNRKARMESPQTTEEIAHQPEILDTGDEFCYKTSVISF